MKKLLWVLPLLLVLASCTKYRSEETTLVGVVQQANYDGFNEGAAVVGYAVAPKGNGLLWGVAAGGLASSGCEITVDVDGVRATLRTQIRNMCRTLKVGDRVNVRKIVVVELDDAGHDKRRWKPSYRLQYN